MKQKNQKNPLNKFFGDIQLINFKQEKINLEIELQQSVLLGQRCFYLICHNVNAKMKVRKLLDSEKMRRVMVASISHELKTPLNGLFNLLNVAESLVTEKIKLEVIKPALICSDVLADYINNIIDYTRMNSTIL